MGKYALSNKELEMIGGKAATLHASAAETTTGDSKSSKVNVARFKEGNFFLDITVDESTAADKLDVTIVTQCPVSGQWYTIATFTQAAGNAGASHEMKVNSANLGEYIAAIWTITDDSGSASFTFTLSAYLKIK